MVGALREHRRGHRRAADDPDGKPSGQGVSGLDMQLGDIVRSRSGRDSGRVFMVCGIIDDAFVLIADGDLRKREKPKKKRLKHLEPLGKAGAEMIEKLASGKRITDAEVRETLKTAKEEVACQ